MNARGSLRSVSQAFADVRCGNAHAPGFGGPCMARHIESQIPAAQPPGNLLEQREVIMERHAVEIIQRRRRHVAVHIFLFVRRREHSAPHAGQHPRGGRIVVTGDDLPELRRKGYAEHLMRFLAFVVQRFVSDLRFPQIAHIHERHSPGIETEEEHVAGFIQHALSEVLAGKDSRQASGDGQFRGSGRFERNLTERITRGRNVAAPTGSVIQSSKCTHVKINRIAFVAVAFRIVAEVRLFRR